METTKPKRECVPVQATDRGSGPAPGAPPSVARAAAEAKLAAALGAPAASVPTASVPTRSSAPPPSAARAPLATLPDGVPSMLWEEAVESERYIDDAPDESR